MVPHTVKPNAPHHFPFPFLANAEIHILVTYSLPDPIGSLQKKLWDKVRQASGQRQGALT